MNTTVRNMNKTFRREAIHLHPDDNVMIATRLLESRSELQLPEGQKLRLIQPIPRGHKFSLRKILCGESVQKYGTVIGKASCDIAAGEHVHSHNLSTQLEGAGSQSYHYDPEAHSRVLAAWQQQQQHYCSPQFLQLLTEPSEPSGQSQSPLSFQGYLRSSSHPGGGLTGVRNEIWLLPMVQCVNKTAELIICTYLNQHNLPPDISGIYHYPHPYGCSQLGDDLGNTRRILQAMCQHPNTGGILLLGLGCENNTFQHFCEGLDCGPPDREHNEGRIRYLRAQDCADEIESGVALLHQLCHIAAEDRRSERPLSELKIGLKCGGSDGFSGLTANPLLGRFSDFLIAQGGTTVLSEVPEMFGAEQLLMDRAASPRVFDDIVRLVDNFKAYFERYGERVFENPSPGNKQGGITTLEDKSLGCVQKGGNAPVEGVHQYAERIAGSGLHLLCSPGNDGVSSSAMAAAGCQLILFSTGRGTPLGCCVPTLKISSNSALARFKSSWIDFDAGRLLETGQTGLSDRVLCDFVRLVQATANGQPAKNEKYGFRELTIFKDGVTL